MSNKIEDVFYKVKDGIDLVRYGLSNELKNENLVHIARYPNNGIPLIQFQVEGTNLAFRVPESILEKK